MKRSLIALALTCVFFGSALAETIDTCGAPAPGNIPMTESVSLGDIPSTGSAASGDMPTCGLSIVLTILDLAF